MKYKNKLLQQYSSQKKQKGLAIIGTVVVLLIVLGLASIVSSKKVILETKMVFNMQDKQRSLMAAESTARFGWNQVKSKTNIVDMIDSDDKPGYYILGNDIAQKNNHKNKNKHKKTWEGNKSRASWPWKEPTKRLELAEHLGGDSNPMKIASKPQYTIGLHNSTLRKGTANYSCIPVTIIGASQGGNANTRTLIELKAIPKSTCYREKIK